MALNRDANLVREMLLPRFGSMTPDAARAVLGIKLRKPDVSRFNRLSSLAKKGALSDDQRDELDSFLRVGNFLTLLHAEARVALARPTPIPRRKSA